MKYPKLYSGEVITIDDIPYMVTKGLSEPTRNNKIVYNVELRSVKYLPEKYREYYRTKNTMLPPFEKVK